MKYYLGIDGGGTKTVAVVSDEFSNVLFECVGRTINFYSVGMAKARENLSSLFDEIYKALGRVSFSGVCIGCSALDCEATPEVTHALCDGIFETEKLHVNSDVYIALQAAGKEKCRAVAICGTGSMAIGEKDGEIIVKGGWGHIAGDEGSAYSIAVNSLKAAFILFDENKITPLVNAACSFFGVNNLRDAIDKLYSDDMTKDVLASFSEKVGAISDEDVIAKTVILNEAHGFSRTVISLLDELGECTHLYLYGGVFKNNRLFEECFRNDIFEVFPDLKTEHLSLTPQQGALKVAQSL